MKGEGLGELLCILINLTDFILKEMGIPEHLTCLLRNPFAGWEATVRTGHGTTYWFQIRKGVRQGYMLSPCLFNFSAEYIMRNAGLEEAQAGIKEQWMLGFAGLGHSKYQGHSTQFSPLHGI